MTEINDGSRTLFLHDLVEFIYVQVLWLLSYLRCKEASMSLRVGDFYA